MVAVVEMIEVAAIAVAAKEHSCDDGGGGDGSDGGGARLWRSGSHPRRW